jgi:hypothetical protein
MNSQRRSVRPSLCFVLFLLAGLVLVSVVAQVIGSKTEPLDAERRVKAFEEACITNLRAMNGAQGVYWGGDANKGYARTLQQLGPKGEGLIEPVLASGTKSFYRFQLIPEPTDLSNPVAHHVLLARPTKRIAKDQRNFCSDERGVIRFTTENRAAAVTDQRSTDPVVPHLPIPHKLNASRIAAFRDCIILQPADVVRGSMNRVTGNIEVEN